eukprot:TRINITY_DN776_c0_g2_i7.p1 TRINITY_DN776_c0_g2~~TRINITY_DN776_c0_g2_i7.p1  ORF type:complete len:342 (+),score=62.80 TRINITY_DN776_c0_g2_i7:144-1169(+)
MEPLPSTFADTQFEVEYVNSANTTFELWWRFTFLIATSIFICVFAFFLRRLRVSHWTVEQKWTSILLFALIAYDNPAFPLYLLVSGWFPIFINQVLFTTFFATLLLFWLVTFDGVRKESQAVSPLRFYLPKGIFMFVCWVLVITLLTWNQIHLISDPTHSYANDIAGYIFLAVVAVALVGVYVLWVAYLVFRAFVEARGSPFLGPRIRFLGGVTVFVMVMFIVIVVVTFLHPPSRTTPPSSSPPSPSPTSTCGPSSLFSSLSRTLSDSRTPNQVVLALLLAAATSPRKSSRRALALVLALALAVGALLAAMSAAVRSCRKSPRRTPEGKRKRGKKSVPFCR